MLGCWIPLLSSLLCNENSQTTASSKWPHLKTTYGLPNPFGGVAFHERPFTAAEAASKGWRLMDSCNGIFAGHRYGDPDDPSLVLLYDDHGYIAGVQSGLLVSHVEEDDYPFSTSPVYQLSDSFGMAAYFTTAYFTDPAVICNGGRTEAQFNAQGLGDRLLIQNGATPDTVISVPLTQAEADADPMWYDHLCFLGMGDHYMTFNHQQDQDCDTMFPVQILYNHGQINGFVWQHLANLPGDKWEHPDQLAIRAIVDKPPSCLMELADTVGLSTMHHYFHAMPWLTTCPLFK